MNAKKLQVRRPEEIAIINKKETKSKESKVPEYKKGAKNNKALAIITGTLAGFLNGIFGGGGGMVVVPMLTKFLKLSEKTAHATAILIILPLSLSSAIFYLTFGSLEQKSAFPIILGVVIGGIIGAILLKKLPAKKVAIIFYSAMLFSGVKMLFF